MYLVLMVITSAAMREAEREAIRNGVSAENLMEDAAATIARFILSEFSGPGIAQIFAGKGNNGGDALAVGAILKQHGWVVATIMPFPLEQLTPLARRQFERLNAVPGSATALPGDAPRLVVDGLLGTGTSGTPRPPLPMAIRQINRLRKNEGCRVLAVDLPSGLGAQKSPADDLVLADWTVALGAVKMELLLDHATNFVGRLVHAPLPALTDYLLPRLIGNSVVATAASLRALLPRREFDLHKAEAGRVAIIAGSPGMTGAAILAGLGALRGGAGLVTLVVPDVVCDLLRSASPPELMVLPFREGLLRLTKPGHFHAFAFGPGLGMNSAEEALGTILNAPLPGVIDADGLNALAQQSKRVVFNSPDRPARLLTPHPGEFARLFPEAEGMDRTDAARRFAELNPAAALLLKGSRTIVAAQSRGISYNTTGQPGMATAGIGDVLSGLCAALLARGLDAFDAGQVGSWLLGRAAELAMKNERLDESFMATDLLNHLGASFESLRRGWP